jgi:hypothetical protein
MSDPILDQHGFQDGNAIDIDARCEELAQTGFLVDTSGWIRKAWEIFQKEPGYFIGLLLISQGISIVVQLLGKAMGDFMSVVLSVGIAFVLLPMNMGYAILARKIMNNERYSFNDLFGGYKMAGELIVVYLIYGLLVAIGMVLLLAPGIYLAVAFAWGPYLMFFYGKGAYESLDLSRKVIRKQWWGMFGFLLVAGLLLNIAGLMVCLVGLLVSIPVSSIAFYVSMHETLGMKAPESETSY